MSSRLRTACYSLALLLVPALAGCGDDGVSSEEDARRAYFGLDVMVGKAIDLGFDGYNAATSANIPPQTTQGTVSGTLRVSGQVDQGKSNNKEMRLSLDLSIYADDPDLNITYATEAITPGILDLSLKNLPNGTLGGTLAGSFYMTGELRGAVTLALSMVGDLEPDPDEPNKIRRKPGTTRITGTAHSDYGVYAVDITR